MCVYIYIYIYSRRGEGATRRAGRGVNTYNTDNTTNHITYTYTNTILYIIMLY